MVDEDGDRHSGDGQGARDARDALDALVARIEAPEPRSVDLPEDLTGELRRLAQWWQERSDGDPRAWTTLTLDAGADDARGALLAGAEAVDRAVDAGSALLVPTVSERDDVAARAIIGLLTRREASAVVGQPEGMTDRQWMALCAAVRDRMADVADLRAEPIALLESLHARPIAAAAGALLAGAARRTPCLVDGTDELAAALVADRISYRAKTWWRAGADSPDPGRQAAVERIDLTAGLPLALSDDAGRGARATVALLQEITGPSGR